MKKTMLVLKYERFALIECCWNFEFFLFWDLFVYHLCKSLVERTFLLVESERMCIIIFVWFFFSNQELKENKTLNLKGETFHMLCHFTRLDWNKQLCFSKIITIDCFVFVSFVCVVCFSNIKNAVWILKFLFVYIIWKLREWGKGNCLM